MEYLDERKVAALLGISVLTLQKWRFLRKGPRYQKIGGKAVRYPVNGLREWLALRPAGGEAGGTLGQSVLGVQEGRQ
jgi:predicted DNA-binding transcriptional regulator AlpA